jgi:hypothetical protein
MARGWESKSAEAQADLSGSRSRAGLLNSPDSETLELIRRKENIVLSRTRVIRELSNAQNPRYKAVLHKALADLDAQLARFPAD